MFSRLWPQNYSRTSIVLLILACVAVVSVPVGAEPPAEATGLAVRSDGSFFVSGLRSESPEFVAGDNRDDRARIEPTEKGTRVSGVGPGERVRTRLASDSDSSEVELVLTGDHRSGNRLDNAAPISYALSTTRLMLAWPDIQGTDSYAIFVDDELVRTSVRKNKVTIPKPNKLPTNITVLAVEAENGQRSNPDLIDQIVTETGINMVEGYKVLVDMGAHVSETRTGNSPDSPNLRASPAEPNNTTVRHTSFIPDAWVGAPSFCGGGWNPGEAYFFRGDNRSFSATSPSHRTQADVYMPWSSGSPGELRKSIGLTRRYIREGMGEYQYVDSDRASAGGIVGSINTVTATRRDFDVDHTVKDPYCPAWIPAAVNANFQGTIYRGAGNSGYHVHGSHERTPNFEFYYKDNTSTNFYTIRRWNRGGWHCITACTMASYSYVR